MVIHFMATGPMIGIFIGIRPLTAISNHWTVEMNITLIPDLGMTNTQLIICFPIQSMTIRASLCGGVDILGIQIRESEALHHQCLVDHLNVCYDQKDSRAPRWVPNY